ncbi:hypothetical protein I552_9388 [Mycobacterium xenopi 3993]|nr:hypothetical protein I552_9388 [Mycobacterium xenopi 3993]
MATFVERALRLDDAAVIRIRTRPGGLLTAWVTTGFDVLASRVVAGTVRPDDLSAGANQLAHGLAAMDDSGYVDPGFPMDSAWRGGLPPESGFTHLDDVPARVLLDLAQRGAQLAKDHGSAHGPPVSLLDQEVVAVTSGDVSVGIPMRCVFALTAMVSCRSHPRRSTLRRWCGFVFCRPGYVSTPVSDRCIAVEDTQR